MYEIEIYEDANGKSEIKDYMFKLNRNNSKENRLKLNEPYIKKLDKEIWELRPLRDRILFASVYKNKFVLLSCFFKDTQKTPKLHIERARKLLEDYKKRSEKIWVNSKLGKNLEKK